MINELHEVLDMNDEQLKTLAREVLKHIIDINVTCTIENDEDQEFGFIELSSYLRGNATVDACQMISDEIDAFKARLLAAMKSTIITPSVVIFEKEANNRGKFLIKEATINVT